MAKKNKTPEILTANVRITRPEIYPSIYVNNIQISVSPWDFRLELGEMQAAALVPGHPQAKEAVVQQKLSVVFSPELAETLAELLAYYVKQYKEQVNKLPKWQVPKSE